MTVNKAILIGRLGRDPEQRHTATGDAIVSFSIATDERWRDKQGQTQTRTEWHNITMFGRLAEIAAQFLRRGSLVYIEGRIQSRKYTGKDGVERLAVDIVANEMKMLGSKGDARTDGMTDAPLQNDYSRTSDMAYQEPQPVSPQPVTRRPDSAAPLPMPVSQIEDDIPF